jgi:hypothetical protein
VIPQNEISGYRPDPCEHLKRLRTVTNDITEADQSVHALLRDICKHRLPRLPVGMDVRENGITHEIPVGQVKLADGLSNADALANLALYQGALMRKCLQDSEILTFVKIR